MAAANRIRLLDFLRAMAVVAMIFYHFVYDLGDFGYVNLITVINGYWKLFAQCIGCSFLFISGVSFWVAVNKEVIWSKFLKRLIILSSAALLISLATYIQFGQAFIFFGILHLLAACSIFAIVIFRLPAIVLFVVAMGIILLPEYYYSSQYYNHELFSSRLLSWTGLFNGRTGSVDFYAFMPWSSAYVIGIAFAKILIKPNRLNNLSPLSFKEERRNAVFSMLLWIGRNSLLVYLIHQPILYGLFYSFESIIT